MPSLTLPPVPHYQAAPPTKADLDYLVSHVQDALLTHGFLFVVGHGHTQAQERYNLRFLSGRCLTSKQTDRIFDIADVPFTGVSDEEKQVYTNAVKQTGSFQGYKHRGYWHIKNGVRDQLEHYNSKKHQSFCLALQVRLLINLSVYRDVTKRTHPEAVRPFLPEIKEFAKFNHFNVVHPILRRLAGCRLIALSLELPEDALVNVHNYDAVGETYGAFEHLAISNYPRSAEEEAQSNNVWLKGHTDFGSITLLWSQPVAALQILCKDGRWRWVKHIENALVVNVGDAMDFLTGGYYKGTIHRVVQPPPDQQQHTRLGIVYFVMPDDDTKLIPCVKVPYSRELGSTLRCEDSMAPTMEQWRKGRSSAFGQSDLKQAQEQGVEEEVINGIMVKHWA
ncbi:hypothetical protein JVU11DRAFT_6135 [Chiua virens]|nr:hypothetical protein JVU11DRAFT_6135 [Chiua virens]